MSDSVTASQEGKCIESKSIKEEAMKEAMKEVMEEVMEEAPGLQPVARIHLGATGSSLLLRSRCGETLYPDDEVSPPDDTALVTAVSTLSSEVIGNHSTEADDAGPTKTEESSGDETSLVDDEGSGSEGNSRAENDCTD